MALATHVGALGCSQQRVNVLATKASGVAGMHAPEVTAGTGPAWPGSNSAGANATAAGAMAPALAGREAVDMSAGPSRSNTPMASIEVHGSAPDAGGPAVPAVDAGAECDLPALERTRELAQDCSAELCRIGARYEMRVTSSEPWFAGEPFWTLFVCRTGFYSFDSASGPNTLAFPISAADLEGLPAKAPVLLLYGPNPFDLPVPWPSVFWGPTASCGVIDTMQVPDCLAR